MNAKIISEKLDRNGIPDTDGLSDKLNIYFMLLKEWNSRMDLTAVTDDNETLDKHFIDSLTVLKSGLIRENQSLIDVGTGAGFPGMTLAMARPDLQVALLDSQKKRLSFLQKVIETADIRNVTIVHARAEDGARDRKMREQFDLAAARALAPLNVLCEYLLPFVKTGGYALCWKGPALMNEIETGKKAAHLLGGRIETPFASTPAGQEWQHIILPIRKVQRTAEMYPRKAGTPKARPLGL